MITREFNLNLNAGRSTPLVIFANQFNSDEQWVFTLFDDNGQQYIPSSGSIVGKKADGLGIINSATVTAGKVVVDVTEQITACAGISEFELQLDNGTHGTANFKVVVEKKPSEGAEYSDSDISLIQEALDIVDTLPTGGTAGQVLTKTTNGSSWQDAQAGLPSGGTTGQVLTKTASGSAWQNAEKELPTGGSAGQVLTKTASGTTWSSVDAFPSEGTTGQVLTKATDGVAWTDAGNPTDTQVATAVSDWLDENITPTTPAVDATLTITGAAADAKKTGDEISALKSQISSLSSIPTAVKRAMDTLFQNMVMKDDEVYSEEVATIHAWASAINLLSISATYTQSGNVYQTDSLDSLKSDLVVTANYDNGTSEEVTAYSLSGELTAGTSIITVAFNGKTATFSVTVSEFRYIWKISDGSIDIESGSLSWDSTNDIYTDTSTTPTDQTTRRRNIGILSGVKPYNNVKNSVWTVENRYPIPVPANATKCTYAITPSTQFIGASFYTYDESTNKYTRTNDVGWKQGSYTITFAAGTYAYMAAATKYNSTGTSYPTEVTDITVTFED